MNEGEGGGSCKCELSVAMAARQPLTVDRCDMTLNTPQLKIINIIIADKPPHNYHCVSVYATGYIYPLCM